jgi:hypothetical protein
MAPGQLIENESGSAAQQPLSPIILPMFLERRRRRKHVSTRIESLRVTLKLNTALEWVGK